jgi:hypothetical protein
MLSAFLTYVITNPSSVVLELLMGFIGFRWFLVPADRRRTELLFVFGAILGPISLLLQVVLPELSRLRPMKYDLYIYRFDMPFGQPSFRLGEIVATHPWCKILVIVSYNLIFVAVLGTLAAYLWLRSEAETIMVVKAFVLNCFAAIAFYLIFPVCGPVFAFPHYPQTPPENIVPHPLAINAAPNGIPSVHTSTALLVLWFLRRWWWGRIAGGVFLALTILATLGSGEHYLFDLFCAVPYAIGVVWIVYRLDRRRVSTKTSVQSSKIIPAESGSE